MSVGGATLDLLHHLASRPGHDEVKADFRQLLVQEFGVELSALEFERRVPEVKGRLDALIGRTVFEAKSDLAREWPDIERRLPDYLRDREREEREHFAGIASDGLKWAVFDLAGGGLRKLGETTLDPGKPEIFLAWLDGAVALRKSLSPDPLTVRAELGHESIAYRRAFDLLEALWSSLRHDPAVALKRQLWAQLLKIVYGRETESDQLWLQHTFLVVVAKAIALAVLGLREDEPRLLLAGRPFEAAGVFGAVESDFFDWVVAAPEGAAVVRRIVAHVRRFRLAEVETDVLKVLYESLIDREERYGLGEYYTPDWLAAKMIRRSVERPLEQRVLDPACGSGTFLFHAIRRFIADAEEAGVPPVERARRAVEHVRGMDIHPVAVIIARVTYLLALSPVLSSRSGALTIPVYLGDAMQLSVTYLMGEKELDVHVPAAPDRPAQVLKFPETFCRDPTLFDRSVEALRSGSETGLNRAQLEARLAQIIRERYRREIEEQERRAVRDLGETYETFDELRRTGRDSVWAYVARNLSRPLALSADGGWAHVLVGNPPWVAYRNMSADLQKRFKELARDEQVYVGGRFATQNDLAALFTVRAVALYLRAAGRLAFVLPLAALSRGQFERLRSGAFTTAKLAWEEVWTMDDSVHPLFPVPSCVVIARRRGSAATIPDHVRAFSGHLPQRDAPEALADHALSVAEGARRPQEGTFTGGSVYRAAFRQGATLVPRMLSLVERQAVGRLGTDASAPSVVSRRNAQEKRPWRDLPAVEGRVEAEFLHPVLLGESILPYRVFRELEGVIPVTGSGELLDAEGAANLGRSGLHGWMRRAEELWNSNASGGMTLIERWNYHNELGSQFPLGALRVVYAKAGTNPAACILRGSSAVIDHKLYWASIATAAEARYLQAIFNSETARERTEGLQSRGQFGARDFDKVVFTLPLPRFDAKNPLHRDIAAVSEECELVAAAVPLGAGTRFQRARASIRAALTEAGVAKRLDAMVTSLLDGAAPQPARRRS